MTYNNISGEVCITRVIDKFNIKTHDWIGRCNEWIARCMNELHIYRSFEPCYDVLDINNYRIQLPCDLKILDALVYENRRIALSPSKDFKNHNKVQNTGSISYRPINNSLPTNTDTLYVTYDEIVYNMPISDVIEYTPLSNGWIEISNVESGEITIYFRRLPVTYSTEHKVYFPDIPDDEKLLKALDMYILNQIMIRGYKHELYDLKINVEHLNPGLLLPKLMRAAKTSVNSISSDERRLITNSLITFLHNPNFSTNYLINR